MNSLLGFTALDPRVKVIRPDAVISLPLWSFLATSKAPLESHKVMVMEIANGSDFATAFSFFPLSTVVNKCENTMTCGFTHQRTRVPFAFSLIFSFLFVPFFLDLVCSNDFLGWVQVTPGGLSCVMSHCSTLGCCWQNLTVKHDSGGRSQPKLLSNLINSCSLVCPLGYFGH